MPQGTTTVNFANGRNHAKVSVSAPTITATQLVEAWVSPATTANHNQDEHAVENLRVVAGNIVAGVGFEINVFVTLGKANGIFNIGWVFN